MKFYRKCLVLLSVLLPVSSFAAGALPDPTDANFCQAVQQVMANTEMKSNNTVFEDMPEYRHSKPIVDPLETFQVVSYVGQVPVMVSCKVKGAAHIREGYGAEAAGEQLYCPDIAALLREEAVAQLVAEGDAAAVVIAQAIVLDQNEPFMTGRDYLADFQLSYEGEDGAIHIQSPGLFHDYDDWTTWILPEKFEGQAYCHIATPQYIKALARGELDVGTVMTTADDAPVTPQ